MLAEAFIPEDRRAALAAGRELPARTHGAALFADISGFTPLTEALARQLGPRRGAEVLTEQLNAVYSALIAAVESWRGSVIGFSGDAITCWFDASLAAPHVGVRTEQETPQVGIQTEQETPHVGVRTEQEDAHMGAGSQAAAVAAVHCAMSMQAAMAGFAQMTLPGGVQASLALKTAVVCGPVTRLQVGEPAIQRIDVLAGGTLDALADAEHAAKQGDIVIDLPALEALAGAYAPRELRTDAAGRTLAVLPLPDEAPPLPEPGPTAPLLDDGISRQWVLAPVYTRLRNAGSRFLAELRPATALFLQFGGLDFDGDPHAGRHLDAFVRWVQGVVDALGGAVIQLTTGDKGSYIYAAFGAPVSGEDDMQRAVATALVLRHPPPPLRMIRDIRIGISQGMMRAGPYGSESRLTYGVLGDATNMAARLMTQAEAGQVCASAHVAEAVAAQFEMVDIGLRSFKGKSEPQPVYALVGRRQEPAAALHEPPSPLVGRTAELQRLLAQAQTAAGGAGGVVRLEGEAGAGKSHLASHFGRQAQEAGLRVLVASCQSTAQNSAYYAAVQLVRSLLELPAAAGAVTVTAGGAPARLKEQVEQLQARLYSQNPTWLLRLPLLGDLLGLPIPDNPTTAAFDARLRQEALAALVIDMVRRAAQQQPLLLIVEDAHWLDEASRALLLSLARTASTMPLLLLLVQRPPDGAPSTPVQELHDLAGQQIIHLAELDAAGMAQLVRHRLGGEVHALAMNFVHSLAQGNPFFAEELVDALGEGDMLVQEEGEWRLARALVDALRRANCLVYSGGGWQLAPNAPLAAVDIGVPASIHGLVLSRLDRLPEASKLTLKVASVIGRVFELHLLAAAHPNQPDLTQLAEQFALLQTRDFAHLETPLPQPVYSFKHNITQEAVYQTLLETQRQELHLAIAQALEQQAPGEVERLAHHYEQGNLALPTVRDKALHYIDAAGWRARKEHANETALTWFDRALQLEMRWPWLKGRAEVLHVLGRRLQEEATLLALDEASSEAKQQMEGAMLWAQFYAATGDYGPAGQALQRAQALAVALEDGRSQARCRNEQAIIAWRQGDYATAQAGYQAALQLSAGSDDQLDVQSEAHYGLGLVNRQQGSFDTARAELHQALEADRRLGDRQHEARTLNALGSVASLERDSPAAIHLFTQALHLREMLGDRAGLGGSLMSLAQVYGNLGDYSRVEPLLQQALGIQQAVRNRWDEMLVLNELGILYTAVGQYAQAIGYLQAALERSRSIDSEIGAAYVLCNLSQAQRDWGRLAEATASLQEGLRLAQQQGDRNLEAIYLGDAALTSLRAGNGAAAIAQAEAALALFAELELPLSCTSVHATLAAAHLALGDRTAAEEAVHAALALLDGCEGEGPDYPQRDYWQCAEVLAALGDHAGADRARRRAAALLHQRAGRISDPAMRQSYLTQVGGHAEIAAAGERVSGCL